MDRKQLKENFSALLNAIPKKKKALSPSEFAEKYRKLSSDVSTVQGKFKYSITPYLREPVDALSPYHPARIVAVMKSAQIGFTEGVVVNGILWIISEAPGNIMALSANEDLSKEMIESRLDSGIASCGLQDLIRPNTIRKRNSRTGDTSKSKEFAGGRLYGGSLQSIDKLGKQRSLRYGFFDDWDAAPLADKKQGNIRSLIQQRFATAANSKKEYYISTPETRPSNIEQVYLDGDQRKWHLPCPCCGKFIVIEWKQIKWKVDKKGKLITDTVHYECQKCKGEFKEDKKYQMNLQGKWIPTAEPVQEGFYSYHITALTAAPHMYGWTHYVHQWLDIFKNGRASNAKLKAFTNLVLGEPWQEKEESIKKNRLSQNVRTYEVGTVPQKMCEVDGNGRIIMLTCSCDLNGTENDARLDWEIVGHTSTGSIYSIDHGSIGTYQPGISKKKGDEKREKWSYIHEVVDNNVWGEYQSIIDRSYKTDTDGVDMPVTFTAVDTGYYTRYAHQFIDKNKGRVIGVKGKGTDKYTKVSQHNKHFKLSPSNPDLWILTVDIVKNDIAERIGLDWDREITSEIQPAGFINFPMPEPRYKKYDNKYFVQYEAEQKEIETDDSGEAIGWKWTRRNSSAANHFFDVMVYNFAVRDIFAFLYLKNEKIQNGTWSMFVERVGG